MDNADNLHAEVIRSQAKSMGMEVIAAPLTGDRSSWFLLKGPALFDNHTVELITDELEWTKVELGHIYDSVRRLESANIVLRNACHRLEEEQARIKNNRWYKLLKKLNLI